jgi:S-methylmethionine-dependent homocysteine/selenocysteine methylase
MSWQQKLERGSVVLIDGGTGSELQRRGVPMSESAWSGVAVASHPKIVREVHQAYIEAGAEVIITNTFGTARFVLEAAGLGDRFEEINGAAVDLALQARDASAREVAIAGSISNLPPSFDDEAYPEADAELAAYRELAQLFTERGVDLIALEMMQDTRHAPRAMQAALETGLPVWLGVSCRVRPEDRAIVSFDFPTLGLERPLDALIPMGPSLVAIMHSEIPALPEAIEMVRGRWNGPIGVYPEVGYFAAPNWQFDESTTPEDLVTHARIWVEKGARALGGCCGTTPDHIRALREAFSELEAIARSSA